MGIEALLSTQIIDTTAVGRAVMTAADAAAARTAIGAAATSHTHAASDITSGIIGTARLATGTADSTTYLRGDQTWQAIAAGGISSLNGLTDATQTFQTGTTGTDFGIVSTAGVHTFNLPDASTTVRGVVTTGTQTFAGAKTFSTKVTVPATGTTAGGIGNGNNGIDFFNGVMTYVTGGGYPTFTSAQSFRLGQNVRIEWSGTDNDGYTDPNTRIERWESGHVSVRFGITSCKLSVTNSFTDTANYERAILQFATYASARYAQLACESAGTGIANMNLVLSPKGTGALIAGPMPDGTAVGGNARGTNAIDIQTGRTAATQVASAADSICIGKNNTSAAVAGISGISIGVTCNSQSGVAIGNNCSSTYASFACGEGASTTGQDGTAIGRAVFASQSAMAIGTFCSATALTSQATGDQCVADRRGMRARATGRFAAQGDRQSVEFILANRTTDGTTAVTLFLDGSSVRLTMPSGKILFATMQLVGSKSDGTAVATYMRKFAIRNRAGTTELIGAVETIGTDVTAGTSFSITADNTNDAVNPSVIGVDGETWRWVAVVYGVELAYGT